MSDENVTPREKQCLPPGRNLGRAGVLPAWTLVGWQGG